MFWSTLSRRAVSASIWSAMRPIVRCSLSSTWSRRPRSVCPPSLMLSWRACRVPGSALASIAVILADRRHRREGGAHPVDEPGGPFGCAATAERIPGEERHRGDPGEHEAVERPVTSNAPLVAVVFRVCHVEQHSAAWSGWAILRNVAAETVDVTVNHDDISLRDELRSRLDHQDDVLHAVLAIVTELAEIATPEARALLHRFLDNPAMRWKNRNGIRRQAE